MSEQQLHTHSARHTANTTPTPCARTRCSTFLQTIGITEHFQHAWRDNPDIHTWQVSWWPGRSLRWRGFHWRSSSLNLTGVFITLHPAAITALYKTDQAIKCAPWLWQHQPYSFILMDLVVVSEMNVSVIRSFSATPCHPIPLSSSVPWLQYWISRPGSLWGEWPPALGLPF